MAQSIYDFELKKIDGQPGPLKTHQGKVLLVVNVASKCGLTPQYEGLESLYEKYRPQGLEVLGFPANEFLGQEPGSNEEIAGFCRSTYGVQFPMYEKLVVKGEGQHPLYKYLTETHPETTKNPGEGIEERLSAKGLGKKQKHDVLWNFEKFLINRQGKIVARFAPDMAPNDPKIITAIEKELAAKA